MTGPVEVRTAALFTATDRCADQVNRAIDLAHLMARSMR